MQKSEKVAVGGKYFSTFSFSLRSQINEFHGFAGAGREVDTLDLFDGADDNRRGDTDVGAEAVFQLVDDFLGMVLEPHVSFDGLGV